MSRALVLGGGGVAGIAWETGVLAGLAQAGVDAAAWDLVVGTSAGAIVGSRLLGTGGDLPAMFARETAPVTTAEDELVRVLGGRIGALTLRAGRLPPLTWLPGLWLTISTLEAWVRRRARPPLPLVREELPGVRQVAGPDPILARLGALAASARTARASRFIEVLAATIAPVTDWPLGLVVTAVDAGDGSAVAFDAGSDIPLAVAVAASSAVPVLFPVIPARGRGWMDGGMATSTHARLAAGCDEVLVVSPLATRTQDAEVAELREWGQRVVVVNPSNGSAAALGSHLALLDPRRRPASAHAGLADGMRAAEALAG